MSEKSRPSCPTVEFLLDSKQHLTTTITMGREGRALLVSSANEKATCFLALISSSDSTDARREIFPQTDQSSMQLNRLMDGNRKTWICECTNG